jgi:hypothetical protein
MTIPSMRGRVRGEPHALRQGFFSMLCLISRTFLEIVGKLKNEPNQYRRIRGKSCWYSFRRRASLNLHSVCSALSLALCKLSILIIINHFRKSNKDHFGEERGRYVTKRRPDENKRVAHLEGSGQEGKTPRAPSRGSWGEASGDDGSLVALPLNQPRQLDFREALQASTTVSGSMAPCCGAAANQYSCKYWQLTITASR